jgi:hypothetical protein
MPLSGTPAPSVGRAISSKVKPPMVVPNGRTVVGGERHFDYYFI